MRTTAFCTFPGCHGPSSRTMLTTATTTGATTASAAMTGRARARGSRPHRPHRCSRCGKSGHNVRACAIPAVWFHQRCGLCGQHGHNARNCSESDVDTVNVGADACSVCGGAGRLPCAQCGGCITPDPMAVRRRRQIHMHMRHAAQAHEQGQTTSRARAQELTQGLVAIPPLSDKQREMAHIVRERTRHLRATLHDSDSDLVGHGISAAPSGALVGRLEDRVGEGVGSGESAGLGAGVDAHHAVDGRCARCMGTGYLTCIACNH